MTCKFDDVLDFIRKYKLLEDLSEEEIETYFHSFPHACKWDKEIHSHDIDCDEIGIIVDKTKEVLDENYDHEYTLEQIYNLAKAFCGVFEAAKAPKAPVPFVIVLLTRL